MATGARGHTCCPKSPPAPPQLRATWSSQTITGTPTSATLPRVPIISFTAQGRTRNGSAACKQGYTRSPSLNCANSTESAKGCRTDKVSWRLFWSICLVRQVGKKQQLSNIRIFFLWRAIQQTGDQTSEGPQTRGELLTSSPCTHHKEMVSSSSKLTGRPNVPVEVSSLHKLLTFIHHPGGSGGSGGELGKRRPFSPCVFPFPFKISCGSCVGFALLCSGFSQKGQAVVLLSRYL